jgi:hypothetical protein
LALPDAKAKEPPAKVELSGDNATHGKQSLKITFAGGRWPTVTTAQVLTDWMPYATFSADVTASRHCVVGFTVLQEKSQRGEGWDASVSRWAKTALLKPGKNTITGSIHDSNNYSINAKLGPVVRFEIFMYSPHEGEAIYVDNIRLTTAKTVTPPAKTAFRVLGTDLTVSGVQELGKKLRDRWKPPEARTVAEVEAAFTARYLDLKKTHSKAVLAILRDGEKGYAGWKDAYWSSHGPDTATVERAENEGRRGSQEVFMRHRSPLMRVDLAGIPRRANILAAELVIVRSGDIPKDHDAEKQPTMWVAEPCNRPWEEYEVNAYEYAKDKFWQAIGGMHYGDDPDFLPIYLAHGPGSGRHANVWDFTEAVRFWTDGTHANHGFMLHGDSKDYMRAHTREAKDVKDRPAVLVIYEPR